MFFFQKYDVYKKAREVNLIISILMRNDEVPWYLKKQLGRAGLSIMLNMAEGFGRDSKADQRRLLLISRGSTYECVAAFDLLCDIELINQESYNQAIKLLDDVAQMLTRLIINKSCN